MTPVKETQLKGFPQENIRRRVLINALTSGEPGGAL